MISRPAPPTFSQVSTSILAMKDKDFAVALALLIGIGFAGYAFIENQGRAHEAKELAEMERRLMQMEAEKQFLQLQLNNQTILQIG